MNGQFHHFRSADAVLRDGLLAVSAVGRKLSLRLAGLPVPAAAYADLPGMTVAAACEGFHRRAASGCDCWLGENRYFPSVTVRCLGYDAPGAILLVAFDGPLLDACVEWSEVSRPELLPWGSGRLRCVALGAAPDAAPGTSSSEATPSD